MKFTEKDIGKRVQATSRSVTVTGEIVGINRLCDIVCVEDDWGQEWEFRPEAADLYGPSEADPHNRARTHESDPA